MSNIFHHKSATFIKKTFGLATLLVLGVTLLTGFQAHAAAAGRTLGYVQGQCKNPSVVMGITGAVPNSENTWYDFVNHRGPGDELGDGAIADENGFANFGSENLVAEFGYKYTDKYAITFFSDGHRLNTVKGSVIFKCAVPRSL